MLKFVIPKGSLEEQTLLLLRDSGLSVRRSGDREYNVRIDDERFTYVAILRPQEIGKYVEEGLFDIGITGYDWVVETGSDVEIIADFPYAKRGASSSLRIVFAVGSNLGVEKAEEVPDGIRVATEYPNLSRRYFEKLGKSVKILPSAGATEAKVPHIADAVVEITETGSTLAAHGLLIIDEVLKTSTKLVANKQSLKDSLKRKAIEEVKILLTGAFEARGKVLLKLNVGPEDKERVLSILPAMRSPTISELADGGFAIETVAEKSSLAELIPRLKDNGATGILEIPLGIVVP